MEIYIIELPKFKKYEEENSDLNLWMKFIQSPEVINMEEATEKIKKAKEVLEEISQDEHERYLAELREKYIMNQVAIEGAGYDKGHKDGYDNGLKVGLQQGEKQKTISIAKKMKDEKINVNIISRITGISVEEIEKLD